MDNKTENKERQVLSHEPVPGYRKVFHLAVVVAVIYLGIIFLRAF